MKMILKAAAALLAAGFATTVAADELTMMVEEKLAALGYATGPVDGVETMETVIAISKFQAENGMEVSGEVTPQLAGILSAKVANPDLQPGATSTTAAPPAGDPAALQAAQEACLKEKMAAAQEAQKKKRGLGRLLSAVTRTASQQGNYEIAQRTSDIYSASATADDLAAAAKDLGLTDDEVAACQNP